MSLNTFGNEKAPSTQENCKKDITKHFTALKQQTGETGTCKKMLPLSMINWPGLAVVFSKTTTSLAESLLHKERLCLRHLAEGGYPVVQVFGEAFIVEQTSEGPRWGMLENYVDGIFIEAKTPAPLKALILACVLEIPASAQKEIWLVRNLDKLKEDIETKLLTGNCFAQCQTSATILGSQFRNLIDLLDKREEMIIDLQMIIKHNGELVIIDPLDIVHNKTRVSVLKSYANEKETNDLSTFVADTKIWLNKALSFCEAIVNATHPKDIISLMLQQDQPLLLSQRLSTKRQSRVNQLKAEHFRRSQPIPSVSAAESSTIETSKRHTPSNSFGY